MFILYVQMFLLFLHRLTAECHHSAGGDNRWNGQCFKLKDVY